jgi:mannose-6-phosphate isomerase
VIYKGVREDVTAARFAEDIRSGEVVNDLKAVLVKPGDVHYLPSGTCHALGAGIVVAEIQTPSDTTYRVYDWGRTDRALHIDQALACIAFGERQGETDRQFPPIVKEGLRTQRLVQTEYFTIERMDVSGPVSLPIATSGMPIVWMMLRGGGVIETPGAAKVAISLGDTVLLPAGLRDAAANLQGNTSLLVVTLPSPLRGMIA